MKKKLMIIMGILAVGAAQLSAQAEFIDQMGLGFNLGYEFENEEYEPGIVGAFNFDYLMGAHIHHWNTAILAGMRFGTDGTSTGSIMDVGVQAEHYFNFLNSRRLTGFGASLAGGVDLISMSDGVVPYIRPGVFWHFATIIKVGLELDYHFQNNGRLAAGIMVSVPSVTMFSRVKNYQRIYVEKTPASGNNQQEKAEPQFCVIQNKLTVPIDYVYISRAGENTWQNVLASESIAPEEAMAFDMPSFHRYDIRAVDSDGNTYTFLNLDFSGADGSVGKIQVVDSGKMDR